MCISAEVSISAFIFCSITCIYLYRRNKPNDRWIAIAFGYLGCMQLLEYLMWIDQECSGLNQIATDLGFIHNILQPLVSLLVAYLMIKKLPKWIYIPFLIYIIYSLPKIWISKKKNQCSKPCSEEKIGLSWEYTNTEHLTIVWLIFTIALCIPFLTMKKNGYIYFILIMGTYIASHFIAENRCQGAIIPSNGSWWCLMATLIPFSAIFIN
jgi:hypothetical protein